MFYSPLRYPWWKNKLAKFLAKVCIDNKISWHYIEPYAGGAWVALFLLIEGYVDKVTINDVDRSIYAFRYCVLNETDKFVRKIKNTEISLENWRKQKEIQKRKDRVSLFQLWFSTFFLNRTNISGIINAWPIWWMAQGGKYKINCRFNKKDLIKKIQQIALYKNKIMLYQKDALDLVDFILESRDDGKESIFYFDPPYYFKWESLYLNAYNYTNHKEVSQKIQKIKNARWIVSYDNVAEIKKLYKWVKSIEYSFTHSAYRAREWKEVLFLSKNLKNVQANINPVQIRNF